MWVQSHWLGSVDRVIKSNTKRYTSSLNFDQSEYVFTISVHKVRRIEKAISVNINVLGQCLEKIQNVIVRRFLIGSPWTPRGSLDVNSGVRGVKVSFWMLKKLYIHIKIIKIKNCFFGGKGSVLTLYTWKGSVTQKSLRTYGVVNNCLLFERPASQPVNNMIGRWRVKNPPGCKRRVVNLPWA